MVWWPLWVVVSYTERRILYRSESRRDKQRFQHSYGKITATITQKGCVQLLLSLPKQFQSTAKSAYRDGNLILSRKRVLSGIPSRYSKGPFKFIRTKCGSLEPRWVDRDFITLSVGLLNFGSEWLLPKFRSSNFLWSLDRKVESFDNKFYNTQGWSCAIQRRKCGFNRERL